MSDTAQAWWGVVNGVGQLSEVYTMRGLAETAKGGREDGAQCRVVPVKVMVDLSPPPPPKPERKGLFRRRKA